MRKLLALGISLLAAGLGTDPAAGQATVGSTSSSASSSAVRSGGARVPSRPPNLTSPPADAVREPVPASGRYARPGVFRTPNPTPPQPDARLGAGGIRPRTGNVVYPGSPSGNPRPGSILAPGTPPGGAPAPADKPRPPRGPRTLVYPVYFGAYGYADGYAGEEPVKAAPVEQETPPAPAARPQRIEGRSRVIEFPEDGAEKDDYRLVGLRGGLIYAARDIQIDDQVVRFTTIQGDRYVLSRAEFDEDWTTELNAGRER